MKSRSKSAAPLRFGVVGLGHIAQAAVLPAFRHARPHVQLTALVSGTGAKLSKLGKRYGVEHLASYAEADKLFDSGAIDAVYVATPNTEHAEWVIRAAEAGLHVLCEKPLATTVRDCERMIDACERNGVTLMTAYRLHFERCNLEVAELVRKKRIGKARYFDSQFSMQVKAGNIRTQSELGGGPEWDIGIYCQNAARYVFADEPTQVWATAALSDDPRFAEIPESVHVILKFPGERIANFICSFGAADRSRYEIVGTKGSIVVDPAYEYAEGLGYELTVGEKKKKRKFAKSDQFAPELVYFADCVRRNRQPEPSGKEGLIDVAIIEAIHESIERGEWIELRGTPRKQNRPTMRQELRRPPVPREPPLVQAESGHS
ncbi:MAG TPA: Gfo/Idh/MocA family oxidoreductase [Steroidobacteraceae bacterium]|nr:Gfo/Idh/MocA family oxidoreductase [Steroidobacteraceae bacterium]